MMLNYLQMFLVLFCAINPVLAWVMFANISQNFKLCEVYIAAALASMCVFAVLSLCMLFGQQILDYLGIQFFIIQLGGGLLMLIIGMLDLLAHEFLVEARFYITKLISLFGMTAKTTTDSLNSGFTLNQYDKNLSVGLGIMPLALPIMLNPASILVAIFFNCQLKSATRLAILEVMLGLAGVIFCCLVFSSRLTLRMSQIWLLILTRSTGLFLTVIGLEMLIEGLRVLIPYLLQ